MLISLTISFCCLQNTYRVTTKTLHIPYLQGLLIVRQFNRRGRERELLQLLLLWQLWQLVLGEEEEEQLAVSLSHPLNTSPSWFSLTT